MKTLIALVLCLSWASAVQAGPVEVSPGAVEAAVGIQAHLADIPRQAGGALDAGALLSKLDLQLSAPDVDAAEAESGMAVMRYMTDHETAAKIDAYLRTARTADDPALGKRTADSLEAWFAAVHKGNSLGAFIETERRLAGHLSEIGMLDEDQVAAAMDGSAARAGTVASRAASKKAAIKANRLTLGQKIRSSSAWDRIGKIAGHPAWGHADTAARVALPAAAGGAAAFLEPLIHIGATTMNGMLISAAAASSVFVALSVLLGLRVRTWERNVPAWGPAMTGFLLGALILALTGVLSFSAAQLLVAGGLTLAAALVYGLFRGRSFSAAGVAVPMLAGAAAAAGLLYPHAGDMLAAISLVLLGVIGAAFLWTLLTILSLLGYIVNMITMAALIAAFTWLFFPMLAVGGVWLFVRRARRRA